MQSFCVIFWGLHTGTPDKTPYIPNFPNPITYIPLRLLQNPTRAHTTALCVNPINQPHKAPIYKFVYIYLESPPKHGSGKPAKPPSDSALSGRPSSAAKAGIFFASFKVVGVYIYILILYICNIKVTYYNILLYKIAYS